MAHELVFIRFVRIKDPFHVGCGNQIVVKSQLEHQLQIGSNCVSICSDEIVKQVYKVGYLCFQKYIFLLAPLTKLSISFISAFTLVSSTKTVETFRIRITIYRVVHSFSRKSIEIYEQWFGFNRVINSLIFDFSYFLLDLEKGIAFAII